MRQVINVSNEIYQARRRQCKGSDEMFSWKQQTNRRTRAKAPFVTTASEFPHVTILLPFNGGAQTELCSNIKEMSRHVI